MCEVVKCENVYCVIQTIQCVPFSEYPKKTSRKLFDSSKRYVPAPPSLNTLKEGLNVEKKVECCVVYESCGFHVLNLEFQHRDFFFSHGSFSRISFFFFVFSLPLLLSLKEGLNVKKKVELCVLDECCGFHVLNLEFQHREIFFFSRKLLFFSLFLSLCSSDSPLSLSIENLTTFTTTQILFISNQIK